MQVACQAMPLLKGYVDLELHQQCKTTLGDSGITIWYSAHPPSSICSPVILFQTLKAKNGQEMKQSKLKADLLMLLGRG